jgi:uncharacterized protein (DUF2249 family)
MLLSATSLSFCALALFIVEFFQESPLFNLKNMRRLIFMSNVSHQSKEQEEVVLDVRQVAPPQRHPLIFQTFENLKSGEAFLLVNDHDPKPLYYQFKFEREGQFTWDYLEQGPQVWRVRVGRPGTTS